MLRALVMLVLLGACGDDDPEDPPPTGLGLERLWPSDAHAGLEWPGCLYGSPLPWSFEGRAHALAIEGRGTVMLVDPETGEPRWTVELPVADGEVADVYATPVIVGARLVIAYHTLAEGGDLSLRADRLRQRVAVVDLEGARLDPAFEPVDLSARVPAWDGGEVEFLASNALARAQLVALPDPATELGRVIVTYGNARDIQPWHGWAFELDLDAWRDAGAAEAVAAVLVTTAENDCGTPGESGSDDRQCGGGLWAPSGPLLVPEEDGGHAVILATGNGRLDLDRRAYANTLLRVRAGLDFDPGCDATACADFDPDEPAAACVESCRDLFIPRVLPGQGPPRPENGLCDGLGMFECWQVLDYIGGSTPVRIELPSGPVLVYPTKDGHVYLIDAEHLGTLHDRLKLVEICGTAEHECRANWAGMMVTQPAVTELDGVPFVVVPTFMQDGVHPAGVFGIAVLDDPPHLETRWRTSPDDATRWRIHPSRVALDAAGEHAFVLERPATPTERGWLVAIETATGRELARERMTAPAQRFTLPLVLEDVVIVNSCDSDQGPGRLEGWRVSR